jgi:tetratricopeptide (TPR) repeat protein
MNIGYTLAERYEGSIDKLLCDEKGTSLILAWGLPPFAHEDDPRRALRASLELYRQLAHPAAAAGIATGMAFCGPVGNNLRREYTLIGSVVNLAARLMQAAAPQGILLCDDATAIACGGVLSFQRHPSLKIKGFDAPIPLWQPGSDQGLRQLDLPPMVGHQRAKDRLLDWMQGGEADRLLVVSGPAGSGKSLLIGHALADARALGLQVVEVCVDPLSSDTPLQPWRRLLRLIIKENEAVEPALRSLIGLEETTGTFSALQADIDSEQRAARLRFAVTRRLTQAGPLVLCLDQARDLDSASWALLLHVLMEVPLLRVLLGMRPEGRPLPSRVREVVAESTSLVLEPLHVPELRLLAMQVLAASQISEDLVIWLEQKTGGNPFFCDQLLKTMLESGAIEVRGGVAFLTPLTGMALPDTIQAALLTRLDRLDPTDQLILKVASVTGNQFSLDLLKALYPISQDFPKLPGRLHQLCTQGLLREEAPHFHFCHRLVREVAYGLILPSQRRPLHGITARWYTQRPAQAPGMALLAWHHRQAGDWAEALTCLELAAQEALQASACRESLELLTQAREIAVAFPVAEIRRGHWEQMAGEAWHALGDLGKSQDHLAQALSLLGFPLPVSPFAFHFSLLKQVIRQIRHRFYPPVQNGSPQALSAAMALERMSENHFFAAEAMDSILCSLWALNLSETVLPSDVQARTLGVVSGILGGVLNFHGAAVRYSERALQLARQLRQPATEAWVNLLWGLYRIGAGDWPEAVARLSQSAEVYREQGLLRRREECYHHLGWALLCQGEIGRARAVYEALRESSLRSGDAQARAWAWTGLAEVDLREGKLPVRLEEALQETQHCEDLLEEGKVLGLAALASLRAQQPDQALAHVDALLLRARQMRLSFYHGGFSAAAEVLEALPLDRPRVTALRRVLWLLSLSQPVARPLTARMEALLASSLKARRQALERSLAAAQQLQMTYEMAVAQARLRDLV